MFPLNEQIFQWTHFSTNNPSKNFQLNASISINSENFSGKLEMFIQKCISKCQNIEGSEFLQEILAFFL